MGYKEDMMMSDRKRYEENPEWRNIGSEILAKLLNKEFDGEIKDAIFQLGPRQGLSVYEAMSFAVIWTAICTGGILGCAIAVGHKPGPNSDVEGNNQKLRDLPTPFKAYFDPNNQSEKDGILEWEREIHVSQMIVIPQLATSDTLKETSTNDSPRAWMRTFRSWIYFDIYDKKTFHVPEAVARWPYGSEEIILLIKADNELWSMEKLEQLIRGEN